MFEIMFGTVVCEYIMHQLQHEKLRTGYRYVGKVSAGKIRREQQLIQLF